MIAEIISIGDELLIGQVVNTNASWMASELSRSGIQTGRITAVADRVEEIVSCLEEAGRRAGIILITGGLGPTKDDITKEALCRFFNTELVFSEEIFQDIQYIFSAWGRKIAEMNRKQAEVPASCSPVRNLQGTAPGMWFERDGSIYVSMPGVPFEMKAMMTQSIIPALVERFQLPVILHKTILTTGLGESLLAKRIEEWEESLPGHMKLAYLPQPGMVRLRITSTGDERQRMERELESFLDSLHGLIGEYIFGFDNDCLASVVGQLLAERNLTISVAESCTGGFISHLLTSIPGSSRYFTGSVVSYDNRIKTGQLGVPVSDLDAYGAVSEQVAVAMAYGIRKKFNTSVSVSASGIAGPDGGTDEKPVGTIWVGISMEEESYARKFQFGYDRERNIVRAGMAALDLVRRELLKPK